MNTAHLTRCLLAGLLSCVAAVPSIAAETDAAAGKAEAAVRYQLEGVRVRGNRKTLDQVVLRHVPIRTGEYFSADDERLESMRYRLLVLGLFSEVRVTLRRGSARGQVVLDIAVVERNTIVVRDLTFGLTRIAPDWDQIVPFGSLGVEERSFLGTGVALGAGVAASRDQVAYNLYLSDRHFLDSKFGLHVEGIYAEAREFFGEHYLPGPIAENAFGRYEQLDYRRAGIRLGSGYNLLADYFFWFDYRFENIVTDEPVVVEGGIYQDPTRDEPVVRGFLEPDASALSAFLFGFQRDTTNHPVMPFDGSSSELSITISSPVLGSSYNYAKFLLQHRKYIPFGRRGQSICLSGIAGLITGTAPFFEQFFVGDFSSLVPDRRLGLNFSNLHPRVLDTAIVDVWYEDMVLSLGAEYQFPFYRGSGSIYAVNGFISFGAYAITSADRIDEAGVPLDITGDLGIRIDTVVGVFSLSFANVLQLIPPVRKETTR